MSRRIEELIDKYREKKEALAEWPESCTFEEVDYLYETILGDLALMKKPDALPAFEPTVEVRKITDEGFLKEIVGFILDKESTMSLSKIYKTQHSPMRTQLFLVKMEVFSEVSVHFVRHGAVGQFHYVSSNRPDWCGYDAQAASGVGRYTPVRHVMILNAQHLVDIAAARLCTKALASTRKVMSMIREGVSKLDVDLADRMQPQCFRQGGVCYEDNPCGQHLIMLRQIVQQVPESIYRDWRNALAIQQAKEFE